MSKHPNVSIMFPICSSCLSISHLKLFGSWQFIRFSSPGQGWAIIKPHQAWRGNHSRAFFSHGVFSQWQAHWLCWFWARLSPFLHRGTSPRYTDRDGWRRRASQTHQAHSSVTVTKQCITPAHYTISMRHAERYTWGLSYCLQSSPAPGPTDGSFWADTDWSIIGLSQRCATVTVYCATDLVNHVESWEDAGWRIIWPVEVWDTEHDLYTVTYSISVGIFSSKCIWCFQIAVIMWKPFNLCI